MTYYSQFGEDRILEELMPPGHVGACVEVGANDGVHGSTTLALEQKGWRCVLVEPNPDLCRRLRTRRRAELFECGAADQEGIATLHIAEGGDHADGVSRIGDAREAREQIGHFGFSSRAVEVRLRTLDAILAESSLEAPIDFISIDVEGLELAVLKGLTLPRWQPRILLIEDNSNFADRAVADHLAARGYVPFMRTGVNDWFAAASDTALATPRRRAAYNRERQRAPARALRQTVLRRLAATPVGRVARRQPILRSLVRRAAGWGP